MRTGYGVSHTLDLGPVDAPGADRYGAALALLGIAPTDLLDLL